MRSVGYFLKLFVRWGIVTLSISLLLFLVAGTTRLPSLRHYLVTFSAFLLATMLSIDPGLAEERSRPSEKMAGSSRFAAGLFFLGTLTVAALDVGRLRWLDSVPMAIRSGSLLLFAAATTLQMWAMVVNPFFSPDIRLQPERGHYLVTFGPYRFLRHPGYLAMLVSVPATALAIGSWLALIPATAFCLTIWQRVRAEEALLQRNLPGYNEYMGRVRGQLFPRIACQRGRQELPFCQQLRDSSSRPEVAMRPREHFIRVCCYRQGGSGSDRSLFSLLSRGHLRVSPSRAAWRRGAVLLPLRGPPGFGFPPKRTGPPRERFLGAPPGNAEFRLGSQYHLLSGCACEGRTEKGDLNLCIRTAFPLSASSATTYN